MSDDQHATGEPAEQRTGWFDRKENARKALRALYVVCAVVLLADIIARNKFETEIESVFGFYGIYGFVGSVALVWLAKVVLRPVVMRSEDYYDD